MRFFINFSLDTKLTNGLPTNASFRDVEKKLNGKNIIGFLKMNNQSYESVKNPLNKSLDDGDYVIFLEGYSFPGSENKNTFINQTVISNLQNKNKEITDPSRYGFMQKSLFGKVTYPLPNPLKIDFSEVEKKLHSKTQPVATQVVNYTTEEAAKKAEDAKKAKEAEEVKKAEDAKKAKEAEDAKKAKEAEDAKRNEEAAKKAKEAEANRNTTTQSNATNILQPVGYFETQDREQCGKHSVNHILQEEKIVNIQNRAKLINKEGHNDMQGDDALAENAQLNLFHYCNILAQEQKRITGVDTNEDVCDNNYEKMTFNGVGILLKNILKYKTYTAFKETIFEEMKLQLQKRRCLGAVLNLNKGHYTAVSKFYSTRKYTYIESISRDDNIMEYDDIDELIHHLKKLTNGAGYPDTIVGVIFVFDTEDAYVSKAVKILRSNLKPPSDYYEITRDDINDLNKNYSTVNDLTSAIFGNDRSAASTIQFSGNSQVEQAIRDAYSDEKIKQYERFYDVEVNIVADFIEAINDINDTEAITKRLSGNTPPPPPPPPPSNEKSQLTLPVSSDSTDDLTEDEKTYLKKLYINPLYLAYDLRNFMQIEHIIIKQPMTMTGKNFTLKNGIMHSSYLKNEVGENNNPPIYQKLYNKSVKFEKNNYENFYKKIEELTGNPDDKWNNVFDWINKHKQNTSSITKEITDEAVEEEIGQLLNKTVSSAQYIPTIFTLLPKILRGDDLQTAQGQYYGRTLNRAVTEKIRKTFKEAINSLNSIKGGKKTHKLKIKKRKTYKRKSFRHKTRNAINRL